MNAASIGISRTLLFNTLHLIYKGQKGYISTTGDYLDVVLIYLYLVHIQFSYMVPVMGLEPTQLVPREPKSRASAYSATPAYYP